MQFLSSIKLASYLTSLKFLIKLFFKTCSHFLGYNTVKRPFLKTAWQGFSKEGYTNWKKQKGDDEKVMFSNPGLNHEFSEEVLFSL